MKNPRQTEMNARLHNYRNNFSQFTDPLWRDTILTPLGQEQAKALVGDARLAAVDLVVCSPLTRALQTCELAYGGASGIPPGARVVAQPLAREKMWHSSDVGRSRARLENDFPWADFSSLAGDWWQWGGEADERRGRIETYINGEDEIVSTPPEEPSEDFAARCRALIEFLDEQPVETISVFCHWGIISQMTGADAKNCAVVSVGDAHGECGVSKLRSFYNDHVGGPENSCEMWRRVLSGEFKRQYQ